MGSTTGAKPLPGLRRAARAFFRADVRLRLGGGVRLEFVDSRTRGLPSAAEVLARQEQDRLQRIVGELAAALDVLPDLRDDVRHLAFVEQSLKVVGLRALDQVPLDVLREALQQFEDLVSNWSPEGLADLRSQMAVRLTERERSGDDPLSAAAPPSADER